MSLADELGAYPAAQEPQYTPRVEFNGGTGTLDTGVIKGPVPEDFSPIFREMLEAAGHDPDTVQVGRKLKESHWQQRNQLRDEEGRATGEYETTYLHAFKFETVLGTPSFVDIEAVCSKAKTQPAPGKGAFWFVFQAGDQQIGKRSRDGSTEEIIERYVESVEIAKEEFKSLKRLGIEGIQICLPGDCLEGNQSQGGKNLWLTQEPITEQNRIMRRLMMHTVEAFAPLVDKVYLDVVNGNHDEASRQLNFYPGDGWATECAITISDILKVNEKSYGHVEVRVPEKWSGFMTVPVGNTVVTIIHGHQWRKGQAFKWWSEQAISNQPAGASQILQNGHYHEWGVESNGERVRIASSTYDCGSDWYRESHGAMPRRGGLVYLLNDGEVSHMSMV